MDQIEKLLAQKFIVQPSPQSRATLEEMGYEVAPGDTYVLEGPDALEYLTRTGYAVVSPNVPAGAKRPKRARRTENPHRDPAPPPFPPPPPRDRQPRGLVIANENDARGWLGQSEMTPAEEGSFLRRIGWVGP